MIFALAVAIVQDDLLAVETPDQDRRHAPEKKRIVGRCENVKNVITPGSAHQPGDEYGERAKGSQILYQLQFPEHAGKARIDGQKSHFHRRLLTNAVKKTLG